MIRRRSGLTLLFAALAAAAPQADSKEKSGNDSSNQANQQWTCVPGKAGRWQCGDRGAELDGQPLPDLESTVDSSLLELQPIEPGELIPSRALQPTNPAPLQRVAGSSIATTAMDSPLPNNYALKLASVSSLDEIQGFVDSYGLDPVLVRTVSTSGDGFNRQIILWGDFASPSQANRAAGALPSVVKAMRPQLVQLDDFPNPPSPFLSASGQPNLTVAPQSTSPPERSMAVATKLRSGESGPALEPEDPTPSVNDSKPGPKPDSASGLAVSVAVKSDQAGAERPAPRAAPPTSTPQLETNQSQTADALSDFGVADRAGDSGTSLAADQTAATSPPEPGKPTRQNDSSALTSSTDLVTDEAEVIKAPSRQSPPVAETIASTPPLPGPDPKPNLASSGKANAARSIASTRPARSAPREAPSLPQPGAGDFRSVEAAYTIQLTSLPNQSLVGRYIQHHDLDPKRIFSVSVDEGRGRRTLLLFGEYEEFAAAEAAQDGLPTSVRAPWVRRVAPLHDLMKN